MKISYDKKIDAFSIVLNEGRISKDVEISENVFAGFDRSGQILEVQFLEISKTGRPWLTLEAAAKYLDKSERTLMRWIKAGKVKPKKVGRQYRIDPKDLEKFAS
ncbi:MAG: helix-turn-helix domain-containing protein [Bdellovibrionales bacterium]|nr:helix-turn-helix domain-containing protein [Bdellovibrionales bacterium]